MIGFVIGLVVWFAAGLMLMAVASVMPEEDEDEQRRQNRNDWGGYDDYEN